MADLLYIPTPKKPCEVIVKQQPEERDLLNDAAVIVGSGVAVAGAVTCLFPLIGCLAVISSPILIADFLLKGK